MYAHTHVIYRYKTYEAMNIKESIEMCEHLVEKLYSEKVAPFLSAGSVNTDTEYIVTFKKKWESVQDAYIATPSKGPCAEDVLASFYLKTILSNFEQYSAQVRDIFGKEIVVLKDDIRELSNTNAALTSERDLLQVRFMKSSSCR